MTEKKDKPELKDETDEAQETASSDHELDGGDKHGGSNEPSLFPVLALRDIVIFPSMIVPLFVGREKSVSALEDVMKNDRQILLVTQKDANIDDPQASDLNEICTIGSVLQLLKLPDGTVKVLVEGQKRGRIEGFTSRVEFFEAYAGQFPESKPSDETETLFKLVVTQFEKYVKLNKRIPGEVLTNIEGMADVSKLADTVAQHLNIKLEEKQELLETLDLDKRLEKIFSFMEGEINVLNVEKRIRNRVKKQMEKTQREYYLNEQIKAIQKELGDGEGKDELSEIEERIASVKLSDEAREKCKAELKKLRNMSPMSAEASVIRNYLDWLLDIPWKKRSRLSNDINRCEDILNEDHYGLEKVKERILEYLAVQSRLKKMKGSILCLVGPPGVGKTSLGRSIARATNRQFVRMSLGGVRDESEMRGHRRTYIGSMPGRIVQGMKKAKTSNPLFLLDEIDKLGADWRGDPSSALLEILDPEQNNTFNDHYLEVDYDLSDVMFVCTANSLNMPQPLKDRMEIIHLSGYTEEEKIKIAEKHLVKKQFKNNGVKKDEIKLDTAAIRDIMRYYTREAGVRGLEREISRIARKSVRMITSGEIEKNHITPKTLKKYLGVRKFRYGVMEDEDQVGVVTGLAWTEAGGDILYLESVKLPGKGKITFTGRLGDVMKESIQAAEYLIKSRSCDFGIDPRIFNKKDVHIHVPEGATPKDGPSAGVGMVTAIVSTLTGIPVRRDVAMTGEITLRGRVLPIGGLKEKLLAAMRGGITTAIIPVENKKDIPELPKIVRDKIAIHPVTNVDEVLAIALTEPLTPIDWPDETLEDAPIIADDKNSSEITHH